MVSQAFSVVLRLCPVGDCYTGDGLIGRSYENALHHVRWAEYDPSSSRCAGLRYRKSGTTHGRVRRSLGDLRAQRTLHVSVLSLCKFVRAASRGGVVGNLGVMPANTPNQQLLFQDLPLASFAHGKHCINEGWRIEPASDRIGSRVSDALMGASAAELVRRRENSTSCCGHLPAERACHNARRIYPSLARLYSRTDIIPLRNTSLCRIVRKTMGYALGASRTSSVRDVTLRDVTSIAGAFCCHYIRRDGDESPWLGSRIDRTEAA